MRQPGCESWRIVGLGEGAPSRRHTCRMCQRLLLLASPAEQLVQEYALFRPGTRLTPILVTSRQQSHSHETNDMALLPRGPKHAGDRRAVLDPAPTPMLMQQSARRCPRSRRNDPRPLSRHPQHDEDPNQFCPAIGELMATTPGTCRVATSAWQVALAD